MNNDATSEARRSSDESRLVAIRNGNQAETERFVREHAVWMLAVARRIVRGNAHAEDVVQNAFANVFKSLDKFEGRSALKTWMHRIVVNQALMVLRKERRAQEASIDGLLPVFDERGCRLEDSRTSFETPETLMQQSQTRAKIAELIDSLPDNYRIVLLLRDIEEMSTAEVAEELALSEGNVKVTLHRARAALKKLLEPMIRRQAQ